MLLKQVKANGESLVNKVRALEELADKLETMISTVGTSYSDIGYCGMPLIVTKKNFDQDQFVMAR